MTVSGELLSLLRRLRGKWTTHIVEDLPDRLLLRYGRVHTLFDRQSAQVLQRGRVVGMFSDLARIELHLPMRFESVPAWEINLVLRAGRSISVGQSTSEEDTDLLGARIASITALPVVLRPASR